MGSSGGIDFAPLAEDGAVDQTGVIGIPGQEGRRGHEHVERDAVPGEVPVEMLGGPAPGRSFRHDDQKIDVASGACLPACNRSEDVDPERMHQFDDLPEKIVEGRSGRGALWRMHWGRQVRVGCRKSFQR